MKLEDVKVGMRVKLRDKTKGERGLNRSIVYNRMLSNNQVYAYVISIEYHYNSKQPNHTIIVNDRMNSDGGDFFDISDLEFDIKRERKEKLKEICSSQEIK